MTRKQKWQRRRKELELCAKVIKSAFKLIRSILDDKNMYNGAKITAIREIIDEVENDKI